MSTSLSTRASTCCACTHTSAAPELYDAADEAGLLLWQDMPLQWGYARSVRKQAIRQARKAVDLLGHHPSIVIWCGHNVPVARRRRAVSRHGPEEVRVQVRGRSAASDVQSQRARPRGEGGVREGRRHSPCRRPLGRRAALAEARWHRHARLLTAGTTATSATSPASAPRIPRMARFVSEFGAQAVPADAEFLDPEKWPDLDWEHLGRKHALQKAMFDRYVPPEDYASFDAWRRATQVYQSTVIKHHIETLRRLKYRPTGGFAHFMFADAYPGVTWSVLGHDRQPKAGFQALVDACRPVIVVAERPPAVVAPGDSVALDVHVVSDLRAALSGAVVTARLVWAGGHHTLALARRRARGRLRARGNGVSDGARRPRRDGPRPRPRLRRPRRHEPLPLDRPPPRLTPGGPARARRVREDERDGSRRVRTPCDRRGPPGSRCGASPTRRLRAGSRQSTRG